MDAVVVGSESDLKSTDANTKIITGNEQTDNVIAAGVVGLGVGVGGVLLAQHLLNKPDCRYRRFDMGGLFGGNTDCNRRPTYPSRPRPPYHGGGGYREPNYDRPYRPYRPPSSYEEPHRPYRPYREPYRPARPYKEPYRPQRPYDDSYHRPQYQEAYRPNRPSQNSYREPHRPERPYREPHTPYRNPKPNNEKPAVYRPSSSQHGSNTYFPPGRGRTAAAEGGTVNLGNDEAEGSGSSDDKTIDSKETGKLLGGHVRFADK